jgi:hypothetical protein
VGRTPMERLQGKIRSLKQYLRGWAKNTSAQYKKEKKEILNSLDMLDKKAEHTPLQANEINIKQCLSSSDITGRRNKVVPKSKSKRFVRRRF